LGLSATVFGVREKYWFASGRVEKVRRLLTIERGVIVGGSLLLMGIALGVVSFWVWARSGYGDLSVESQMRIVVPASVLSVVGIQIAFTCFLFELLERPKQ